MKIKSDFVLRQVAGTWIVLPLAEKTISFSGMLTLNDSGAMLWKLLERGCDQGELVCALTSEYAVSEEQAGMDVQEFIDKLKNAGCLDCGKTEE